jgi:predicted ATP-dependent serine protease
MSAETLRLGERICIKCGHEERMHIGKCRDSHTWRNYVRGTTRTTPCDCDGFAVVNHER